MCSTSSGFSRGLALAALVCVGGCNRAVEGPGPGAPPAVSLPVGPIPGPKLDSGVPTNPYPSDQVTLQQGRLYFARYNCSGCHGDHGGGGMGPSLRDDRWIYGSADYQIFNSIAEGRAHGMPTWGLKLPEEHIWKLVAYIHSLRTPHEPEPPVQTNPPPPKL